MNSSGNMLLDSKTRSLMVATEARGQGEDEARNRRSRSPEYRASGMMPYILLENTTSNSLVTGVHFQTSSLVARVMHVESYFDLFR